MKVWVRVISGEKILKSFTYSPEKFKYQDLQQYLEICCNELDEPTPIILNKHVAHLNEFNNTIFKQIDFVEAINFEKMVVEIFDENFQKEKR